MPTPSTELAVPYVSTTQYDQVDCQNLKIEFDKLSSLEQEFTRSQVKRIEDSRGHALFYGWGRGDGMETIELVKARGEKAAVSRARNQRGCKE